MDQEVAETQTLREQDSVCRGFMAYLGGLAAIGGHVMVPHVGCSQRLSFCSVQFFTSHQVETKVSSMNGGGLTDSPKQLDGTTCNHLNRHRLQCLKTPKPLRCNQGHCTHDIRSDKQCRTVWLVWGNLRLEKSQSRCKNATSAVETNVENRGEGRVKQFPPLACLRWLRLCTRKTAVVKASHDYARPQSGCTIILWLSL